MRLVVLGGGESGVGAAILGRQLGYFVFLSERLSVFSPTLTTPLTSVESDALSV